MTKKKKSTNRNAKNLSEAVGFSNIFHHEKIDFLLGLILFAFAIYVVIAMISFLSTGQADQSILQESRAGEWMNNSHQYTNRCGSFGAIISWWLISENFGFSALLIPAFFILVALKLMNAYKVNVLKWFFGMSVVMIWCSLAFTIVLTPMLDFIFFNQGGNHGVFIIDIYEYLI